MYHRARFKWTARLRIPSGVADDSAGRCGESKCCVASQWRVQLFHGSRTLETKGAFLADMLSGSDVSDARAAVNAMARKSLLALR